MLKEFLLGCIRIIRYGDPVAKKSCIDLSIDPPTHIIGRHIGATNHMVDGFELEHAGRQQSII